MIVTPNRSRGDRLYYAAAYILVLLVLIITVYPLYFVLIASFSDPWAVAGGQVILRIRDFQTTAYERIFEYRIIWTAYANTLLYTVLGTAINVAMTMTAAYVLSRRNLVGGRIFMGMIVITMYFSGGLIPTYFTVSSLGMLNTIWAMVIPGAVNAFNLIIARTFMASAIPNELQESAMIDGCSHVYYYIEIALPLSGAIIGVLTLYYAVDHWNSYMTALIYLQDRARYPLQLILREILIQSKFTTEDLQTAANLTEVLEKQSLQESLKYGLVMVASIPMLALYPFLQRFFVKGVMIGALKG